MSTLSIDKIKADGFTVPSNGIAGNEILVLSGKAIAGTTVKIFDKVDGAAVHLGDASVGPSGFWTFTTEELSINEHKFFIKGTVGDRSDGFYTVEVGSPLLTEADIKFTYNGLVSGSEVNVTVDPNHQHLNTVSVDLSMFGGDHEVAASLGEDGKYHASYTITELPEYTERPLVFNVSATATNGVGSTTVDTIAPELTDAMIQTTAPDDGVVKIRVNALDLLEHEMDHVTVDLSLFGGGTDVDVPLNSKGTFYVVKVTGLDTTNLTDKYVVVTAVDSAGNENGFVDLVEAPAVSLIGVNSFSHA